jgi:hypothetical protein
VVVTVYDNGSGKLFYQIGFVNRISNTVEWGDPEEYGTGKQPSVALVRLDSHLYVIEVHCVSFRKECFIRVGEVEIEGVKRIEWRVEYQHAELQCSVVNPKTRNVPKHERRAP